MSDTGPGTWNTELYAELRAIAERQMRDESGARTLQPTALLHEAWLRLRAARTPDGARLDAAGLRVLAAGAMRRIRIDSARRRRALRRERPGPGVSTELAVAGEPDARDDYVLALDAALDVLGRRQPDLARIVELKFFGGLDVAEIAAATGSSERTVKRRWRIAKAILQRDIERRTGDRDAG